MPGDSAVHNLVRLDTRLTLYGGIGLSARVVSIQVGLPTTMETIGAGGTVERWTSAIKKRQVDGPVWVGRENLVGDGQADLKYHGGPDKAVMAYSAAHYPAWQAQLNRPLDPGAFGENLTIDGLDESTVCIGDTYLVGDTCVVQVSQPRQPCWKLSRRWEIPDLEAWVRTSGRTGWYFRVLSEGFIEAGSVVTRTDRPYPKWTIRAVAGEMNGKQTDSEALTFLATCPLLSEQWRNVFAERLNGDGTTA